MNKQKGASLVESVVAMTLLVMAISFTAMGFGITIRSVLREEERSKEEILVSSNLEIYLNSPESTRSIALINDGKIEIDKEMTLATIDDTYHIKIEKVESRSGNSSLYYYRVKN